MRRIIVLCLIFLLPLTAAGAGRALRSTYDLALRYNFDNYEFDRGGNEYLRSRTINAFNFALVGGLDMRESSAVSHLFRAGISCTKDMGSRDIAPELLAYYSFNYAFSGSTVLQGVFGIYPSDYSEEEYSRAFVSDSLRFYDRAYEGMMFKLKTEHSYSELWLDWMGMHGQSVRERFRVVGATSWKPWSFFKIGADFSMYHFAGSVETPGVVDNILASPYVKLDFSTLAGMRELSLKASMLAGYQRDRKFGTGTLLPLGGELELRARYRRLGLDNVFYAGGDLMPFYDNTAYGKKYGNTLYFGSPFYRASLYDRMELYFAPYISRRLDFRISAVFHFAASEIPYQGTQQMLTLLYRL